MSGFPNTPSEWVKKAREGDANAIGAIYDLLFQPAVNNAHYRMGALSKNKAEAEDLVSDKLIKVLLKLKAGEIEGDDNFSGYFYRALTNAINDYFDERRHKKPMLTFTNLDSDDFNESFEDRIANGDDFLSSENVARFQPEENLDYSNMIQGVNDCLANLPERQRSTLFMFYQDGRSIKEIGQLLNAKENTVKSWLRYGRLNLEKQIRKLQKENKGFLTILPIPFMLWVFEENAKQFSTTDASKIASEIVLLDEGLKNKQKGRDGHKSETIQLKQAKSYTQALPKNSTSVNSQSMPVVQTSKKTIFSHTVRKILVGAVVVGVISFGAMTFISSRSAEDSTKSTEKTSEIVESKYKAGLYSFTENLTVYDAASLDSANGYTVHVNDSGAGENRIYLSEIVESENVYYGKIEGGYVCLDDGSPHLSYESEKPIMLSDYDNSSDFATACDNPSLANGGLGGTRPEGWYFNYTAVCDGTLIYY